MVANPTKMETIGVRDRAGRFLPGHPGGPGRPKGIDFRRLILDATGEGDVEADLLAVYQSLLAAAREGDVAAAKLLLDRLAGPVHADLGTWSLEVVTGVPREVDQ